MCLFCLRRSVQINVLHRFPPELRTQLFLELVATMGSMTLTTFFSFLDLRFGLVDSSSKYLHEGPDLPPKMLLRTSEHQALKLQSSEAVKVQTELQSSADPRGVEQTLMVDANEEQKGGVGEEERPWTPPLSGSSDWFFWVPACQKSISGPRPPGILLKKEAHLFLKTHFIVVVGGPAARGHRLMEGIGAAATAAFLFDETLHLFWRISCQTRLSGRLLNDLADVGAAPAARMILRLPGGRGVEGPMEGETPPTTIHDFTFTYSCQRKVSELVKFVVELPPRLISARRRPTSTRVLAASDVQRTQRGLNVGLPVDGMNDS